VAIRAAASVCAPLRARRRYSADVSNCVHGMGHGFMDVLDRRIGASLRGCDGLRASWERRGCYSGVFMENLASEGDSHALRPGQPLYPCNAVGRRYKPACYERQSTYALFVSNGDFRAVFRLCAKAERDFRGGMAEAVKHGLIADAEYFAWMEHEAEALLGRDEASITATLGSAATRATSASGLAPSPPKRRTNLGLATGRTCRSAGYFGSGRP